MNNYSKRREFIKSICSFGTLLLVPSMSLKTFGQELPNVLLIGDSISIGYTPFVKIILDGKANVSRPHENCGWTEWAITKLDQWVGDTRYKVIYFNFGLHDLKHVDPITKAGSKKAGDPVMADLPTYVANLNIIVEKLKKTGATLIFATTTPVPENSSDPLRESDMPDKYNNAAKKMMKKQHVEVDDLYNFVLSQTEKIQKPNDVHFTKEGYEVLAKRVAASVSKYL